jgi:serine/threonine protein phosphatase PrpC
MWRYLAASVQGASHQRTETPCQDYSIAIELHEGRLLLLVCSDGAGSATRSEIGSMLACRTLVSEVAEFARLGGTIDSITRETAEDWLLAIQTKLEIEAGVLGAVSRDLACTLVAAVVAPDAAAFIQVGDGAAVVAAGDNAYRVVFWPEQGEYANTTYFVTGADAMERLRIDVYSERLDRVALFTDGLQHVALRYESRTPHEPFFAPMFARLRSEERWESLSDSLRSFLASEAVSKRTDDDCTLVLACRSDD